MSNLNNKSIFVEYKTSAQDEVAIRKDDITFLRVVKNKKKKFGYVVIVGLVKDAKDQHEFFDYLEEAEDFVYDVVSQIGDDEFTSYETINGDIVTVRREDVSFVRVKENDNGSFSAIVGLSEYYKAQNEYFETKQEAQEFKTKLLNEL